MKIKPMDDRLVVKRQKAEEKTAGGIVLPSAAQQKSLEATVVAVGPGKRLDNGKRAPMDVKKGDVVLLNQYGGTEVTVEGEKLLILRESDVLAIKTKK